MAVSPYLKSLSMVAANKLLHLLEAFSTSWFLFSVSQNHHLVFFLLEAFNNIIQYQFDGRQADEREIRGERPFRCHTCTQPAPLPPGNCNLVYAIIRKRNVFHQLANLPSDAASIQKALQRKRKCPDVISRTSSQETVSMEGSHPAVPAEPGTLKASLVAMPGTDPTSTGKLSFGFTQLTAVNQGSAGRLFIEPTGKPASCSLSLLMAFYIEYTGYKEI